jgi:hypothetical protein
MNKKILLLLVIIAGIGVVSCNKPAKGKNGVTYKTPVQYNDYIVSRQSTLMNNVLHFGKAAQLDLDSANHMLDGFEVQADKMIEDIKGMPPYKNDSALRDAAINSFTFYKRVFRDDYKEIIRLRQAAETDESTDVDASIRKIVDKLTIDEDKYDKAFHNAQQNFAAKNKMRLRDNNMQKEADKFSE